MNDFKNERDLNSKFSESQTSKTCVKFKLTVEMAVTLSGRILHFFTLHIYFKLTLPHILIFPAALAFPFLQEYSITRPTPVSTLAVYNRALTTAEVSSSLNLKLLEACIIIGWVGYETQQRKYPFNHPPPLAAVGTWWLNDALRVPPCPPTQTTDHG